MTCNNHKEKDSGPVCPWCLACYWEDRYNQMKSDRDGWKASAENRREVQRTREKQVVRMRDIFKAMRGWTLNKRAHEMIAEALAATDDLDGLILCEREPVALSFVTGSTHSKVTIGFDYGAELKAATPSSGKSLPLYRARRPE